MSVEDLIRTVMTEFRQIVKTETVVGEPIEAGGAVVVPVSRISFGFGAGGGGDKSDGGGSGTGGGASVEPLAFVVIRDGKAQILPVREKEGSVKGLLDLAPDLLSKVKDFKEKRDRKKTEADAGTDSGDDDVSA